MRRRRSAMVMQHANVVRVVILGKKGVGKSGKSKWIAVRLNQERQTKTLP